MPSIVDSFRDVAYTIHPRLTNSTHLEECVNGRRRHEQQMTDSAWPIPPLEHPVTSTTRGEADISRIVGDPPAASYPLKYRGRSDLKRRTPYKEMPSFPNSVSDLRNRRVRNRKFYLSAKTPPHHQRDVHLHPTPSKRSPRSSQKPLKASQIKGRRTNRRIPLRRSPRGGTSTFPTHSKIPLEM